MKVSIIQYNLWRGFHDKNHQLKFRRMQNAQKVVHELNPDILCLNEANYAQPNDLGIEMRYDKIFDYPYVAVVSYPCFDGKINNFGSNVILSRYPMSYQVIQFQLNSNIRAAIQLPEGVLNLDLYHLSSTESDNSKILNLSRYIKSFSIPYLLIGDLNSVSPNDSYNRDIVVSELNQVPKRLIDQMLEGILLKYLVNAGLREVFNDDGSSIPTFLKYQEQRTGMRVDHVLASDDITILEAKIIKNKLSEFASDHYPLYAEFDIHF